jgi:hypothetical protein
MHRTLMNAEIQRATTVLFTKRMLISSGKVCRAKKSVSICVRLWMVIITSLWLSPFALACDEFVSWVAPAKEAYHRAHRVYPVPVEYRRWADRYLPRLWVHPDSWQPINFEAYLEKATLVSKADGRTLLSRPTATQISSLSHKEQCSAYMKADEVAPARPAPVYVQVFRDQNPSAPDDPWIFIKYNLVFDWSGLAERISPLSRMGAYISGGKLDKWHRLDVHTAAIVAVDAAGNLRLLTLAQHNTQQTYIPGVDFPSGRPPMLVAAKRSNELYLDNGDSSPVSHRVVPFFDDVAYLIDPKQKPLFWAIDITYGRNAGGKQVPLKAVFIEPQHPLADFAGLLAPPKRFFGYYIGRDGPPGYNYYAPPAYFSMTNFAAMGYWREGDVDLLEQISPFISNKKRSDWSAVVSIMRGRLAEAVRQQEAAQVED